MGGGEGEEEGGLEVEALEGEAYSDAGLIQQKLDEINAKLTAIRDSVETEEVVVKTWFESSE